MNDSLERKFDAEQTRLRKTLEKYHARVLSLQSEDSTSTRIFVDEFERITGRAYPSRSIVLRAGPRFIAIAPERHEHEVLENLDRLEKLNDRFERDEIEVDL